jgi:transposase
VTFLGFCAMVSAWEIQQVFAGTSWGWNSVAVRRPNYCAKACTRRRWPALSVLIDNPYAPELNPVEYLWALRVREFGRRSRIESCP